MGAVGFFSASNACSTLSHGLHRPRAVLRPWRITIVRTNSAASSLVRARVEPSTAAAQPFDSRQSAPEIDIIEVANFELAGLLMLSRHLGKSKSGRYLEGLLDHDL